MPPLKVFVATSRTQGHRDNDVTHIHGPELVDLTRTCDQNRADSGYRCANAFTGLSSGKITTTAEIVERDLTLVQYRNIVHRSLVAAGFDDDPELRRRAEISADEMVRIAASWPIGTIVERRGANILLRVGPTTSTGQERSQRHVLAVFHSRCERCE